LISDLVDSIYGGINTDINAITATVYDGHKINMSVRQGKKVIIFAHGHGSTYATKILDKMATLSYSPTWSSHIRLINIAPTASSNTYLSSLTA